MFQLGIRKVKDSKIQAEKKFKEEELKRLKD